MDGMYLLFLTLIRGSLMVVFATGCGGSGSDMGSCYFPVGEGVLLLGSGPRIFYIASVPSF